MLKATPQNSGSQHLVLGTETIPPGGVIPKHRHLGQDEILFLQTGTARISLNDQDYEVHADGMVFFPLNTWVSLRNTGAAPIQLIFIFSAPGFDLVERGASPQTMQTRSVNTSAFYRYLPSEIFLKSRRRRSSQLFLEKHATNCAV
jgi:quercetin dioxygenase-like cupin family protein